MQTIDLNQGVLELSGFPITGATASVGHSDDLNGRVGDAVDHGVGKTPKKKFSRTVKMPRPELGAAANLSDGVVELGDESICRRRIALSIPEKGGPGFRCGVGMKINVWTSHGIARQSDDAPRTTEQSLLFPCLD